MSGRILAATVHLVTDDGKTVTLRAGVELPEEYADRVTNPAAFVEDEAEGEAAEVGDQVETQPATPPEPTKEELVERLKELGKPSSGNKPELAERLAAALAEQTPAASTEPSQPADE